jgi:hypothetical protein
MTDNQFKLNGYTLVTDAVSPELRNFVTQYALFDEMQNQHTRGDDQVPAAHSKYADPAMEALLLHLLPLMQDSTGLTLIPTYSYYRVYRTGDILEQHQDRNSCEISATVCFNFDYDPLEYTWPIFMAGNAVVQQPGDMVIYRGCDLVHWRDRFNSPQTAWQVQGFFHYVDANGPYAEECRFDGRQSIGEPKTLSNPNKSYIIYT